MRVNQTSIVLWITNLNWLEYSQIYGVIRKKTPMKEAADRPHFFSGVATVCRDLSLSRIEQLVKLMKIN